MADNSYKLEFTLSNGRIINAGTIVAPQGESGKNGVTFIPSVSEAGILSWTNDGGLTNPDPVNIKGDAAVITESDVAGWGFTKNAGTITEIKMNGSSKGTSGVVDLGTVLTEHQSLENYVTLDGIQNITGKKTVIPPANKDNSNQIATTAWAGRRYKSIADFGFTSQTTVKAIVQKIIDNWYEYCTFACTNDDFNNFSDTPDGWGTLIIEVGSNALRPFISFTKQIGDSNGYKHWQANIVRGAGNQVSEIQWYELALKTDIPTNYVTTDTNQGIFGKKWFINSGDPSMVVQSSEIDLNKPPASPQYNYIDFTDKADKRLGVVGSTISPDGYAGIYLQARNAASMGIKANANGEVYSWTHTPDDNNNSDQIATTEWVRSHNQAFRGFDGKNYYTVNGVKKYYPADNYFLVAYTDHCTNWKHVCAEMDVVDLDTRCAVYKLKVSGLLESATSNNITTYTNKGSIGVTDSFGERLNTGTTDINNEFFLVCRTTNKGRVRYEIWYNQRYAYNRHKFYFSVDEAHARTGITEHFTWNKMRIDNGTDVSYAKAGVTAYMDSKKVNPTYIPTSSWGVDVFKTALSKDESYTNVTIFNNNLYSTTQVGVSTILNTTPYIDAKIQGYNGYKTAPTAQKTAEYRILSEDKGYLGGIRYDRYTNGDSNTRLCTTSTLSGASNSVMLYATQGTASTKNTDSKIWQFSPATNDNINLGGTGNRWLNGYITNLQNVKVINGGGGNSLIQQNSDTPGSDIIVGSTNCKLKLLGSGARPTYKQGKNGTYANLALQSDIPTLQWVTPTSVDEIKSAILWKVTNEKSADTHGGIEIAIGSGEIGNGSAYYKYNSTNQYGLCNVNIISDSQTFVELIPYARSVPNQQYRTNIVLSNWKILKLV